MGRASNMKTPDMKYHNERVWNGLRYHISPPAEVFAIIESSRVPTSKEENIFHLIDRMFNKKLATGTISQIFASSNLSEIPTSTSAHLLNTDAYLNIVVPYQNSKGRGRKI